MLFKTTTACEVNFMRTNKTKNLVLCSLFTALTLIATYINFRLPIPSYGGLIHLGSAILFVAAFVLKPTHAALSVSAGMTLFDMLAGWPLWAPFTFAIRFVQVYLFGTLIQTRKNNYPLIFFVYILCCLWEMAGYYVAEAIIYGNWVAPLASMPSELIHNAIGIVVGLPLTVLAQKALKKTEN